MKQVLFSLSSDMPSLLMCIKRERTSEDRERKRSLLIPALSLLMRTLSSDVRSLLIQGGVESEDALSCKSFSAKVPYN